MNSWTEEQDKTLKRMWRAKYTSREIAAALGMTRNAVIGRANRLRAAGKLDSEPRQAPTVTGPRASSGLGA